MPRKIPTLEYVLRFVCGAVVGALLGMYVADTVSSDSSLLYVLVGAVVLGLLALGLGDSLWRQLGSWMRWSAGLRDR